MNSTISIQDVFKISGLGSVPVGTIKSGTFKIGTILKVNGRKMRVTTIEMHHEQINQARTGDHIGFTLDNSDHNLLKGLCGQTVTCSDEGQYDNHPDHIYEQKYEERINKGFLGWIRRLFSK